MKKFTEEEINKLDNLVEAFENWVIAIAMQVKARNGPHFDKDGFVTTRRQQLIKVFTEMDDK